MKAILLLTIFVLASPIFAQDDAGPKLLEKRGVIGLGSGGHGGYSSGGFGHGRGSSISSISYSSSIPLSISSHGSSGGSFRGHSGGFGSSSYRHGW